MTKEEMKARLAARKPSTNKEGWDVEAYGLAHGEAVAHAATALFDAGDVALNYCDALITGMRWAWATRKGEPVVAAQPQGTLYEGECSRI